MQDKTNWNEYNVIVVESKWLSVIRKYDITYKTIEEKIIEKQIVDNKEIEVEVIKPRQIEIKTEQGRIPTEIEKEILEKNLPYKIINGYAYIDNEQEIINKFKLELEEITKWLKDNDWKVNKITLGEWHVNDIRFLTYKKEREIKRRRQEELLIQMEKINESRI